ncbi:PqqD family protein [Leptospira interrogans]
MSNNAQSSNINKSGMRSGISQKWDKITTQEAGALTKTEDLVALVQSKYNLDEAQARKDVDAFANGRQL